MQSPEADRPSTDASPDPQALKRPAWVYVAASVAGVVVIVLLLGALGVFQTGESPTPPAASGPFITISEPVQGAVVPIPEAVTVRGEAGALFENNVVVQALDEDGNVLVQEPTTAQAPEIGGTGPWSIQLVIPVKP